MEAPATDLRFNPKTNVNDSLITTVRNIAQGVYLIRHQGGFFVQKLIKAEYTHTVCRQEIIVGSVVRIDQCVHVLHWFEVSAAGIRWPLRLGNTYLARRLLPSTDAAHARL